MRPRVGLGILLALLALALLLLPLGGCISPSGGTSVVAQVSVDDIGDARFDGNVFVGHGSTGMTAMVYLKGTWVPLYGPVAFEAGERVVARVDPEYHESFELHEPIPAWCAGLYPPGVAESLGITFAEE